MYYVICNIASVLCFAFCYEACGILAPLLELSLLSLQWKVECNLHCPGKFLNISELSFMVLTSLKDFLSKKAPNSHVMRTDKIRVGTGDNRGLQAKDKGLGKKKSIPIFLLFKESVYSHHLVLDSGLFI